MLVGADGRLLSPEGVGGEGIEEDREEGWDASPCTKEKRGLLHICIDSINLGYSEPLCQAFSVGHINPKG